MPSGEVAYLCQKSISPFLHPLFVLLFFMFTKCMCKSSHLFTYFESEREIEPNPEWERGQLLRNISLVVYEKFDMAWCLSGDVGNYKKHHSTRFEEVKVVDP